MIANPPLFLANRSARLICAVVLLACATGRMGLGQDEHGELIPHGDPIFDPVAAGADEGLLIQTPELELLDEPAETYSSGEWIRSGGWYFEEDVVVLQKAEKEDQLLARDLSDPALTLALRTTSDPMSFEPGARITFGKVYGRDVWNRDHMIEVRYFGMFDWPSQATIASTLPGGVFTTLGPNAGDVAALNGNDRQRYIETSSLDNFDVNFRMRTRGSRDRMVLQHDGHWVRHQTTARVWTCYAGLTTMFLDESFDILGTGPGATEGRFIVATANDMFGVHFGGEYIEQSAVWNWGLRGRLGGLATLAERRSVFTSQIGAAAPTSRSERSEKDNLTFLIEGGIFASAQVTPNATVRVGYDVLYLAGISSAVGNLNLPVGTFSPMEVNDIALYHGGSVGFTMVW